jgi:hypothetical protein
VKVPRLKDVCTANCMERSAPWIELRLTQNALRSARSCLGEEDGDHRLNALVSCFPHFPRESRVETLAREPISTVVVPWEGGKNGGGGNRAEAVNGDLRSRARVVNARVGLERETRRASNCARTDHKNARRYTVFRRGNRTYAAHAKPLVNNSRGFRAWRR